MKNRLLTTIVGTMVLGALTGVQAAVYHVAANGTDAASGSSTAPWQTPGKANSAAIAGDVGIVHAGQYHEGISPANNGTPGSPITFQAAAGECVVLNATTGVQITSARHDILVGYKTASRNPTTYGVRGSVSSAYTIQTASVKP